LEANIQFYESLTEVLKNSYKNINKKEPLMKYKQFKKMDAIKLPVIGIGTWSMGGTWYEVSEQMCIDTIHASLDHGVNFIDTAPIYGFGTSETIVGKAIKDKKRDEIILATKCGLVWNEKRKVKRNLTKESILKEIDESLGRLKTDYIDLYQCHWPDYDTNVPVSETMEALLHLQEKGKIRFIGLSNFPLRMLEEAQAIGPVASYQGLYNMLEHNPSHYHRIELGYKSRDEILPYCVDNEMYYLPYSPLMQGLLSGKFQMEGNFKQSDDRMSNPKLRGDELLPYLDAVEKLKLFAQTINKPLYEIAINWLAFQDGVGPVICGMNKIEHVEKNSTAAKWSLTQEQFEQIETLLTSSRIDL
jgi:aryl-alcohol dehydrogenase-like predicted oxidoreductase